MYEPLTRRQLGVIRVLFAAALAFVFVDLQLPADPFPREFHLTVHPLADVEWVHALAEQPVLVGRLEAAILVLLGVFALGAFTRTAYVALVAALTVWTLVRLTHTGVHNWGVMLVTLWALLPVRWGDGVSVDALLRTASHDDEPKMSYGWVLWAPGLVFGTAMWGAGVAKLSQAGLAWITNGSVKYHFVSDAAAAPTDWGLWVASHHTVAVLMSAAAVATELSMIVPLLFRSYLVRLPFAVAAFGLLAGFYVFQNEIWPAWWVLFAMFFVPWPRLIGRDGSVSTSDARVPVPMVLITAVIVAVQVVASVERVEIAPVMSDYPMYSTTYASVEEYERSEGVSPEYRYLVRFAGGDEIDASETLDRLELNGPVRDAYLAVVEKREGAAGAPAVGAAAIARLSAHFGRPVAAVVIVADQQGFNWTTGQMEWRTRDRRVWEFRREGE